MSDSIQDHAPQFNSPQQYVRVQDLAGLAAKRSPSSKQREMVADELNSPFSLPPASSSSAAPADRENPVINRSLNPNPSSSAASHDSLLQPVSSLSLHFDSNSNLIHSLPSASSVSSMSSSIDSISSPRLSSPGKPSSAVHPQSSSQHHLAVHSQHLEISSPSSSSLDSSSIGGGAFTSLSSVSRLYSREIAHSLSIQVMQPMISPYEKHQELAPRKVLILYTGGTLGMTKEDGVLKPSASFLENMLRSIPEFSDPYMPEVSFRSVFEAPLDSCEMKHEHWETVAQEIARDYYAFDGFCILHGTDTMAYTASALSFMLENLSKPVVLTGSQIPLYALRTDAKLNLIDAILVAGYSCIPEVVIVFSSQVLRGNRARKISSFSAVGAFSTSNYPALGSGGLHLSVNPRRIVPPPRGIFQAFTSLERNVVITKIFPGMRSSVLAALLAPPTRGLVLECFGSGNIPIKDKSILAAVEEACHRGVVIVITTQCSEGPVLLESYESGASLASIGCVPGADITSEAAMCKLAYLLGKGLPPRQVKEEMMKDLRGELSQGKTVDKWNVVF